jgi:tetratricopeptide (TPR) repeat protein
MRVRYVALVSLAVSLSAAAPRLVAAEPLLDPADYLKLLTDSKLHYKFNTKPAATPVPEMNCPRRFENLRVTGSGSDKKLVEWVVKPEAVKLLEEAETFFNENKYEEAGAKYQAAMAADPEAVNAYLFYGDTLLMGKKDAAGALAQYRKGIALDPTLPTGHFFASTALLRLGRTDEAREEVIQALVNHPAYEAIWKLAAQAPTVWGNKPIVRHKFEPPAGYLGVRAKDTVDLYSGPDLHWLGYVVCKAAWANEPQFSERHPAKGWSTDEEHACLVNQVMARYNTAASLLEDEQKKKGVAKPEAKAEEILAALDPLERHLYDVAKAGMLDGYILFEIVGQHCPISMGVTVDEGRKALEAYIRAYVIVPAQ